MKTNNSNRFMKVITFMLLFVLMLIVPVPGKSQEKSKELTLEECTALALENYPAIKRLSLIDAVMDLKQKNLSANYLPQGAINIKASYQSDVTSIPVSIPGMTIDPLSKDQYMASVNLEQLIYDGGVTAIAKKAVRNEALIERGELENELYSIRESVNHLYFGILLNEKYLKELDLIKRDMIRVLARTEALMKEGMANKSDTDAIKAELISLNQRETDLIAAKASMSSMLSLLTDTPVVSGTILREPSADIPAGSSSRPELALFDLKSSYLNTRREYAKAALRPRIGAFFQAGYGRPGLNMLKDEFAPFAITGIKISWNIGSLYTYGNEIKIVDTEILKTESSKEALLLNLSINEVSQRVQIEKIKNLLKDDREVIVLRESLAGAAESKLQNGIISVSDYLIELNKLEIARAAECRHKIELLSAIYSLKHTLNK